MRWVPPVFHDDTTNTPAKSGTDDSYDGTTSTDTSTDKSGTDDSRPARLLETSTPGYCEDISPIKPCPDMAMPF
jgi:hypothetical protein